MSEKFPTNCSIHFIENIFKTHSEVCFKNQCRRKSESIMQINGEKIKKRYKIVKLVVQMPFELTDSKAIRQ